MTSGIDALEGGEPFVHRIKIGQTVFGQFGVNGSCEFRLADAHIGQFEQPDHRAAGVFVAFFGKQGFKGGTVGRAGKQLISIDQVEQCHRFSAQRVNDMSVIDDMAMITVCLRATAP